MEQATTPPDPIARKLRKRSFHSPTGGDPGSPGRPTSLHYNPRPQAQAKKHLLQHAATSMLATHAITEIGLNVISKAAGLPPRTTYYYFNDRDELLADLLIDHVLAINARVCAAFDATADARPQERMQSLFVAFLTAVHDAPDAHKALRLNTQHVSEHRRPMVQGRSRQVIATLSDALALSVPGLDPLQAQARLLLRCVVGMMSESVTWFRRNEPTSLEHFARLLSNITLLAGRAITDGTWMVPAPMRPIVPVPDPPPPAPPPPPSQTLWIAAAQARRHWSRVLRAADNGVDVVLTRRGVPLFHLVPATEEQTLARQATGQGDTPATP